MENNTEEKNKKQISYGEVLELKYKQACDTLRNVGYTFDEALSFKLPFLELEMPIISKCIGVDIVITKLVSQVIEYLADTQGKHLLLLGSCGTGKTLLATKIIPLIFMSKLGKIFKVIKACDLNDRLQEAKEYPFVVIDDFGTESTAVNFGNKVEAFNEVIDSVEGRKCFFVVTSNLDANQIKQKYGVRTYDRLRGLFKVIQVNEKSMR